jgi:hypothetical protein
MRRPYRLVVGIAIVAILAAPLLPGSAGPVCGILEPQWVLLPDEVLAAVLDPVTSCDEQPVPFLAPTPPRGPPSRSLA